MIRWTIYATIAIIAAAGTVLVIGMSLPQGHRASRTVTLPAPPATVFGVLSDFEKHPQWRSGVRRVSVEGDTRAGALVREESSDGTMPFRLEVFDPPRRMVMRIADPSLPFGGTWAFDLRPAAGRTELTITEDGEVYNPIFRFMARFVFGHHATIDQYLDDLTRRLTQ